MNQCADCKKQAATIGGRCFRCFLKATERGHRFSLPCLAKGCKQCKEMAKWAKR